MKVLQINVTCGIGSTGVIAVEIAQQLELIGHDAYIAYGQGTTNYSKSYKIGHNLENKIHGLWHTRILGKEGYGSKSGTREFLKWVDSISPDIIQIHNLHSNFLNYSLFFNYIKKKKIPVVYSLFDCWAFTGKCTHFTEINCRKWEIGCQCCPQLKSGPITWFFDRTKLLYNEKKRWLTSLPSLNIVVCSNWLKGEVEKSFLSKQPITMIYNWIDRSKFQELKDETLYDRYGLDKTKKLLISVSAFWDDKTTRFSDAVRLAEILPPAYQLVIIGKKITKDSIHANMIHIDYVKGVSELSKLYSAAIAFVGFSVEDTFGKVFAESMLCGTPAVVFDSTACSEVIGDTGYAVAPHDVHAMLDKVIEIDSNGRDYYRDRCKARVNDYFGFESNVSKYISLYQRILSNNR